MSSIKQLWALVWFQLAITPRVLLLAIGTGFPCIMNFVLFRDTKDLTSLDLLLGNQMIYFVILLGIPLLTPDQGNFNKSNLFRTSGSDTEFLLTRAVDRHLLYRSRSLLFFFLLLIIPLISFSVSLFHPDLKLFESNSSLYHRVMQVLPGSIPEAPDTDGKLRDIFLPNGNILIGNWRVWISLCFGVATITLWTTFKKLKSFEWILNLLGCAFLFYFCFPRMFFHASSDTGRDIWDLNTALFFFFATHQFFCWLIAIPSLFLSLYFYERDSLQIN